MEPSYINRFKQRLEKAQSKVVNLVVEIDPPETRYRGHLSVCSPDPALRAQALEMTKKWIDIAAVLGAPSIMPNQGVAYITEDLTPAIEGLKALANYGKTKNVLVIVEPRRMPVEKGGDPVESEWGLCQSPCRTRTAAAGFVAARAHGSTRRRQVRPRHRHQNLERDGLQGLVLDRGRGADPWLRWET